MSQLQIMDRGAMARSGTCMDHGPLETAGKCPSHNNLEVDVSVSSAPSRFDQDGLRVALDALPVAGADLLDFGLITMDRQGVILGYNAFESRRAGLRAERVLGRHFFEDVGVCTNNYLVAQRFHDARDLRLELDEQVDYVFTFRMSPTPVRLRLLAGPDTQQQYLAVRPR
jgi:photoactive yellow protein